MPGAIVEQGAVADVFLHPQHPTTRRFVLEAEHVDEGEQHDDFAHVPGRILRLTFRGEATYAPLLGQRGARHRGRLQHPRPAASTASRTPPYGQLTLALHRRRHRRRARRASQAGRRARGGAALMLTNCCSTCDWAEIWPATLDTLLMLGGSLLFTVLLGLPLGVLLFLTGPRQLFDQAGAVRAAVAGGQRAALGALHHPADRADPGHRAARRHLAGRAPARSRRWWSAPRRSSRAWSRPRCARWTAA